MSAMRRALPIIVAATTGVLSGIYVFKPLFVNGAHDLKVVSGQKNSDHAESQPVTNGEGTK